mmetsp:Transcript_21146/g.38415  ORF Transcript_21146/g.38415 Transcript_21146/m.38415 type:complete len:262 (-) Transcript_21146:1038-1823(-)|eukprot:CAMPEP_0202499162 /NCGR_PEP_ID=MMETSP1361-20130828/28835_1 /ASSEMBLY_ACC=CAM_ASM_000849 /TAXON_ID=210615 /ORGANISM="Staurosira complex sp., Strain CCMP2646" /LENGTH=261 /DNA_ID=CAMNT_0049131271 /DNA_START=152 /DNA_END=937 /DNA_ORIENTATION=+
MPSLRLLPHGGYTLIPATLSTVAWLASLSQDGCDYARLTGFIVASATKSASVEFLEVGFTAYREPVLEGDDWKIQRTGECLAYDENVFHQDAFWMAAKAFAFIALVLGGGGALFLWFSSCCLFSRGTWRWAGYEVLLASISQSLGFLWFATSICNTGDSQCTLSYGSKANIAAAGLWFISALSIFCKYPQPKQILDEDEEEEQAVVNVVDSPSQQGGEGTSERDVENLPLEGDAKANLQVDDKKKGNETVVQTTPAEADLL